MASIKKQYSFSNKRTIWRLIPSESGYLVIEERDMESKQVYFNCLKTGDGKIYFKNFQLEEKYWVGIEAISQNIIFFHKFRKPDMPGHKGIYAFEILSKKIIWQTDELIFLLAKDDKIYAYQTTFDGRQYFLLDHPTGKIIKDIGSEFGEINKLREESMQNDFTNNFIFPVQLDQQDNNSDAEKIINELLTDRNNLLGISWLRYNDYLLFNHHEKNSDGTFNNYFKVFDIVKNKIVQKEKINSKTQIFVFDSFFIAGELLFLLVEKTKLVVYKIMQ